MDRRALWLLPSTLLFVKALRFGSHCLYKLKAVLNAAPAQLMRGSLQNLHEMMLSNGWHKNVACNPPVQTLGVNMPAPPFSQRLLPVQTIPLPPLPPLRKHSDSSAIFSSRILGCLRPTKQPGTALIIPFIHIVGKTPLSSSLFLWTETCATHTFCSARAQISGRDAWKWIQWFLSCGLLLFVCMALCLSTHSIRHWLLLKIKGSFIWTKGRPVQHPWSLVAS